MLLGGRKGRPSDAVSAGTRQLEETDQRLLCTFHAIITFIQI
jgi:hypothetical protein